MKPFNFVVLLFCLVTYGQGRPSDTEEHDEILREAKKDKYFHHDTVGEMPVHQSTESSTAAENVLNRLKSIAHLRMADVRKPPATAVDSSSVSREELEALRDLLDKNLEKYQNYDEHSSSTRRRPNDPYIGQILTTLNNNNNNNNNNDLHPQQHHDDMTIMDQQIRRQMPIRRKIIRHTVFATPMQNGGNQQLNNNNRVYGESGGSRIDWSPPWADYFPILIKDPFQTMMNSFSEIIEYGPAADICRHAASDAVEAASEVDVNSNRVDRKSRAQTGSRADSRLKRSRRNTAAGTTAAPEEEKGIMNHVPRPFRPHHHGGTGTGSAPVPTSTTEDPSKMYHWATDRPASEHNGDTGPQIKRLVVRRGGVAIAGPGGIATAGSGGTAIVGPGGSAYSSKDTASGATADASPVGQMPAPGGLSMAGYGPQLVQGLPQANYFAPYPQPYPHQQQLPNNNNIGYARRSSDARSSADGGTAVLSTDGVSYTFPVPSRGLTAVGGSAGRAVSGRYAGAREIVLPDGAKLIATGPIVYYNPEPARKSTKKRSRKGRKSSSSSSLADNEQKREPENNDYNDLQSIY